MTNWKQNLSRAQEIAVRGFLTLIGMSLLVIAFYGLSVSELKISDEKYEWSTSNSLLVIASILSFWIALDLGRFARLADAVFQKLGIIKKKEEPKDGGNNAR